MNETEANAAPAKELSAEERWTLVREKLESARNASEKEGDLSADEKRQTLKRRAKALASSDGEDQEKDSGDKIEVVEFLLSHEKYAIELSCIREVYPFKECTEIPCTPSFVVGVINVRSRILSVIDLKEFFDLPAKNFTDQSRVVILASDDMEFGVIVDELLGVNTIDAETVQPSLPTLTGIRAQYLKGVTSDSMVILDGMHILQDKRIVVDKDVE